MDYLVQGCPFYQRMVVPAVAAIFQATDFDDVRVCLETGSVDLDIQNLASGCDFYVCLANDSDFSAFPSNDCGAATTLGHVAEAKDSACGHGRHSRTGVRSLCSTLIGHQNYRHVHYDIDLRCNSRHPGHSHMVLHRILGRQIVAHGCFESRGQTDRNASLRHHPHLAVQDRTEFLRALVAEAGLSGTA